MMKFNIIYLFAANCLAQAKLMDLSCRQIREFVDGHNSRRLQIAAGKVNGQPPTSEMKIMVWDDELAAKAAKWASKNHYANNPDITIGSQRFETGENLFWYGTPNQNYKLSIDSTLQSWFDEHVHYTFGPLAWQDFDFYAKYVVGHYTQMAWANSMYIGCAISEYGNSFIKEFLVVCNYGPSGNYLSQKPYKKGKKSSALICGTDNCNKLYGNRC